MSVIFLNKHWDEREIRFLKACIWSVALYGYESWSTGENEKKNIEAFEMWYYRRIKWTNKASNNKVLNRSTDREIRKIIPKRVKITGYILRHWGIVLFILERMTELNWVKLWGSNNEGYRMKIILWDEETSTE